jgi:hypothetical protein
MEASGQRHGTYYIGGWVGLRAGLDTELQEKSCLCCGSNPSRAVCSKGAILSELPPLLQ